MVSLFSVLGIGEEENFEVDGRKLERNPWSNIPFSPTTRGLAVVWSSGVRRRNAETLEKAIVKSVKYAARG